MTAQRMMDSRELDSRTADGIHVRLLWSAADDALAVTVVDRRSGGAFTVAVPSHASALDVFRHPYAYA